MTDEADSWLVLFTSGCALNVVGLLLLDTAAWFIQYAVLGLSVVLLAVAALRAMSDAASDDRQLETSDPS